MERIALFAVLVFVPVSAIAHRVAVVPGVFEYSETGEKSRNASKRLTAQAAKGVEDAEYELIPTTDVLEALETVVARQGGPCRNRKCLTGLAENLRADEVVFVKVTEFGELDREIVILFAKGESVTQRSGDGFMVLLEEIRRLVVLGLRKSPARNAEPSPEPPASRTGETGESAGAGIQIRKSPTLPPTDSRGLSPWAFCVVAGIAVASGITWGVLDSVVYDRYKTLRDGGESKDYWNDIRSLQVADWVMMGVTGAASIAATTLFFLTDFDEWSVSKREKGMSVRISPFALEGGTMVVLDSRF